MNKLKELLTQDWTISACYEDKFYLVASCRLDIIKIASHIDLEMAMIELYEKCMVTDTRAVTDDLSTPS
jgi:hypothetical protein